MYFTIFAVSAWRREMQKALVLEKVQVPPCLLSPRNGMKAGAIPPCPCLYEKYLPIKRKNIPYLECSSTKTPRWTTLQPPYILMHLTGELLGGANISYAIL
jgi:hypothetical protein